MTIRILTLLTVLLLPNLVLAQTAKQKILELENRIVDMEGTLFQYVDFVRESMLAIDSIMDQSIIFVQGDKCPRGFKSYNKLEGKIISGGKGGARAPRLQRGEAVSVQPTDMANTRTKTSSKVQQMPYIALMGCVRDKKRAQLWDLQE